MEKMHIKEFIENMTTKIAKASGKYNNVYEDEDSMSNDVLDCADEVINLQGRLISALIKAEINLTDFLKDIEQFEADMIISDEVWNTEDGLPKVTKEFYDRWIELQGRRNTFLGHDLKKAKTYDELMQ